MFCLSGYFNEYEKVKAILQFIFGALLKRKLIHYYEFPFNYDSLEIVENIVARHISMDTKLRGNNCFVHIYTYLLRGYMRNVCTIWEVQTHCNRGRKTIGHYFFYKTKL